MANVHLFIDGVSASYYKNGVWNVIFPCDNEGNHKVLFEYQKKDGTKPKAPFSLADKTIRIVTDKAIPPGQPKGDNFDLILDLTSNDFHKEGVKFVAQPSIKKSVMTVENALFYSAETKNRMNYVENLTTGDVPTPIANETASLIGVKIELETGGSVKVEVDGAAGFPMIFEDGDLLYIDNDCAGCTPFDSDFSLFQEVFENSFDKNIKFQLLSFALPPFPLGTSPLKTLILGPPPAFCDGFRISKTDDL